MTLPAPNDPATGTEKEQRVFKFEDVRDEYKPLREDYFRSAEELLGTERFEVFRKGLTDWLPLDPESKDSRSSDSLAAVAHTIICKPPDPEQGWRLRWQIQFENGSMSLWREPEEVPQMIAPYVQDWLALAMQKRSENHPDQVMR